MFEKLFELSNQTRIIHRGTKSGQVKNLKK